MKTLVVVVQVIMVVVVVGSSVAKGGSIFATHGHNDIRFAGGPADLNSTETYLIPQVAIPVRNRVGVDNTAVIELIGSLSSDAWSFEERLRSTADPNSSSTSELVVVMNWEDSAEGSIAGQNAGKAFGTYVKQSHPDWINRFGPIAVVGHSRGTAVVDEFVRVLGESNISVDSVTFLDPILCCGDQNPRRRDNVVFAQTLRQTADPDFSGSRVTGTYNLDIGPTIPVPPPDYPHALVYSAFADSIDQERATDFTYGDPNPERDSFGGVFLDFGDRSHERPLEGLHVAVGGEANRFSPTVFDGGPAWPSLTLTQNSRVKLLTDSVDKIVELVFRDPDSENLTLRVLTDSNANLIDGFESEIMSTTLTGGQTAWSLESLDLPGGLGNEPWVHFEISDGNLITHSSFNTLVRPRLRGDFNGDGVLSNLDIDLLTANVGSMEGTFDLTNDGQVNSDDRTAWVKDLAGTFFGDANLDGEFNSSDFITVFQNGKYETGSESGWADGDWNGDSVFDSGDFIAAFQGGGYEQGPRTAASTVPEPFGLLGLLVGLTGFILYRRQ